MPSPLAARGLTKTSHPSALIFRPKRLFLGLIAGACMLLTGVLLSACSPKSEGSASQAAQLAQMADKKMTVYAPPPAPSADVANLSRSRREVAEERVMAAAAPAPAVEVAGSPATQSAPMEGANQRFLAVRHHMQIETAAAELADLWGAVKARCEQLDCQVEASALQRETLAVLSQHGMREGQAEAVERYAFYERVKKAYAIVVTGELEPWGNFILRKGVLGQALRP